MKPHTCRQKKTLWTHTWLETKRPSLAPVTKSQQKRLTHICPSIIQRFNRLGYMSANGRRWWAKKGECSLVECVSFMLHTDVFVWGVRGGGGGALCHAGVFFMLRPGLASRMHMIHTGKESFFQPPKGCELTGITEGVGPEQAKARRGLLCFTQRRRCIF